MRNPYVVLRAGRATAELAVNSGIPAAGPTPPQFEHSTLMHPLLFIERIYEFSCPFNIKNDYVHISY